MAATRHLLRTASSSSRTVYGGVHTVSLFPGDGTGPELATAVKDVFHHMRVPVRFDEMHITGHDESFVAAQKSLRSHGVGLKGIFSTSASLAEPRSLNVQMRKDLDLFANMVRCKTVEGVNSRHQNVDMVIIRENTEGEYSGLEHESVPGVVESLKVITAERARRIAKFAFEAATKLNRRKVTAVHKANIMKLADGFFLQCCREVAQDYPLIEFEDMIVDNCCMQLASRPQQFDVLVMGNLYGNIISNLGAGLVGGAGVVPGVNMGEEITLFEPGARHRANELAGKNTVNPAGMLLSAAGMLRHLHLEESADQLETEIHGLLKESQFHTPDLGGEATTSDFVDALKGRL